MKRKKLGLFSPLKVMSYIISMLQKRRERFRWQIRRKHLDSLLHSSRTKLLESRNFNSVLEQHYNIMIGGQLQSILHEIATNIRQQNREGMDIAFGKLLEIVEKQGVQISVCMIVMAKRVNALMKNVVKNRGKNVQGEEEWSPIDSSNQLYSIYCFLDVFSRMSYNDVPKEQFTIFVQAFWPLFYNESIDIYAAQNMPIMSKLLKTIRKMLESNNKIVVTTIKQLNITSQLQRIIKKTRSSLTKDCVLELSIILHIHLLQQSQLNPRQNCSEINGIAILGMESSSHKEFADLCLKIIRKKVDEAMFAALSTLILIIDQYPHLTTQADNKTIKEIAMLIKTHSHIIQKKALELLCDIIQKEIDVGDELLQKNFILDIIIAYLQGFSSEKEEGIQECSYIVACIICNLCLCSNSKLMVSHKIWRFFLENTTHPSSPFFTIIAVFEYFLYIAPQRQGLQVLDQFLFNVGCLDLRMVNERQMEAIKRTIIRGYHTGSTKWKCEAKVKRMVQYHKLGHFLEQSQQGLGVCQMQQQKQQQIIDIL